MRQITARVLILIDFALLLLVGFKAYASLGTPGLIYWLAGSVIVVIVIVAQITYAWPQRELCRSTTRSGTRCRKRALPKSAYCAVHLSRNEWLTTLFAAYLGFLLAAVLAHRQVADSDKQAVQARVHLDSVVAAQNERDRKRLNAELHREIPWVRPGAAVLLGRGMALTLEPGVNLISPLAFSPEFPSRISMTREGVVYIDGLIRSYDGRMVAILKDSRLFAAPGIERYDVNSDLNTLEVFDSQLGPILQVEASNTRAALIINFVAFVRRADGSVHAVGCTWRGGCGSEPASGDNAPATGTGLLQIFQYPAYAHLGERESNGKMF